MTNRVYSISEIVGSSTESIEDAIQTALETAGESLRNLDWFEVKEIRGTMEDNKLGSYQVVLRVGFRYER